MSLNFNGTDVEKVIYNGVELDKVIYNGVVVWEGSDEFIATVTTGWGKSNQNIDIGNVVQFNVTTGNGGCTVTWDNETKTLPANATTNVYYSRETPTTATLTIKGDFTEIIPSYNGWASNSGAGNTFYITGITKWYSKLNKVQDKMFAGRVYDGTHSINFDLNLPSNIVDLNNPDGSTSSLYRAEFSPSTSLTFANLQNYYTLGTRTSPFLTNATNNGDVWNIGSYVVGIVTSSSQSATNRTDTFVIPNGTTHLPKGLFAYTMSGSSGVSIFKLTGIQFPNDNLITKIPSYFLDGATSLTSISFPASVVKFDDYACRQGANSTSKFNEITFNTPRNTPITFGTSAFYSKSAKAVNIYTDNNISVLSEEWSGFLPTFYKLDRTTQIPILNSPMITRNDNIISTNSVTGANKYVVEISSGQSTVYTQTEIVETTTTPTNINIYDYVPAPTTQTMYYRVRVKCFNTDGDYARSGLQNSEVWSVEV